MACDFSILVATYRRPAALRRLLGSIAESHLNFNCGEVVIVQNSFDEETAVLIESWSNILPIRSCVELQLGQSRALNRGIELCEGDLVLLTDDDAVVSPGWVEAYLQSFARHADVAYLIGPIEPLFASKPSQRWFRHAPPSHAGRDLGPSEAATHCASKLYDLIGVNAAVPRLLLQELRFSERLGPGVASAPLGADVQLGRRLLTAGRAVYYVPGARVHHYIPPVRTSMRYLLWRRMHVGRSCVIYDRSAVPPTLVATMVGLMRSCFRLLRGVFMRRDDRELFELFKLIGVAETYFLGFLRGHHASADRCR